MSETQRKIEQSLFEALAQLPQDKHWLVAFSGGADSTALLQACYRFQLQRSACSEASSASSCESPVVQQQVSAEVGKQQTLSLSAIHINHQLSVHATQWQQYCQTFCESRDIPFSTVSVNIGNESRKGLEQKARDARYQLFEQQLDKDVILLLAHHRQDQQETFFLRLLRGAGPEGLAAMPASREIGDSRLYRPLLGFDKPELLAYLEQQHCNWVEDESNQDIQFSRNYIRHKLMPELAGFSSAALTSLDRSIKLIDQQNRLLSNILNRELELRLCDNSHKILQLNSEDYQRPEFLAGLIRCWFSQLGLLMPSQAALQSFIGDLVLAAEDSQPEFAIQGKLFRRFQSKLYCMDDLAPVEFQDISWNPLQQLQLTLDGLGLLAYRHGAGQSLRTISPVQVRVRQQGDSICLNAAAGHQSLKKVFQQYALPPWQRQNTPLLFLGGELIAIPELSLFACSCPDALRGQIQFQRFDGVS